MFISFKIKLSNKPHNKIGESVTMHAEPPIQTFKYLHVQRMTLKYIHMFIINKICYFSKLHVT